MGEKYSSIHCVFDFKFYFIKPVFSEQERFFLRMHSFFKILGQEEIVGLQNNGWTKMSVELVKGSIYSSGRLRFKKNLMLKSINKKIRCFSVCIIWGFPVMAIGLIFLVFTIFLNWAWMKFGYLEKIDICLGFKTCIWGGKTHHEQSSFLGIKLEEKVSLFRIFYIFHSWNHLFQFSFLFFLFQAGLAFLCVF